VCGLDVNIRLQKLKKLYLAWNTVNLPLPSLFVVKNEWRLWHGFDFALLSGVDGCRYIVAGHSRAWSYWRHGNQVETKDLDRVRMDIYTYILRYTEARDLDPYYSISPLNRLSSTLALGYDNATEFLNFLPIFQCPLLHINLLRPSNTG